MLYSETWQQGFFSVKMADASANTTISNSQGKKFWKTISDDPESGVTVVNKKLHLVIPPYYLDELKTSVTSVIDCRLIRYQKEYSSKHVLKLFTLD